MVTVKCLVCDADNDPRATAGYCENCGKKLPPASAFRSRRTADTGTSPTDDPLPARTSPRQRAAEAVLTACVLGLVGGGLFLVLGPVFITTLPSWFLPVVMGGTLLEAVLLGGLGVLARFVPVGAVVLALLVVGLSMVVAALTSIWIGLGWVLANVAVLIFLVRGLIFSIAEQR
jgi:hypothetical protein